MSKKSQGGEAGSRSYRCSGREEGWAIERVLARRFDLSNDQVSKALRQKRVWRAGDLIPLERGDPLHAGEVVELRRREGPKPPPQPNRKIRPRVVHEDPAFVVVEKPAGYVVHPGPQHGTDTLLNGLVAAYPELVELTDERGWGLVHRLDKETSGLLVVARTPDGYDALRAAFEAREVEKRYGALCAGAPQEPEGEVDAEVDGQEALTRYRLEEIRGAVSRLTLWPKTGRTHQIRVHLAALGCPVLADARHGAGLTALTARLFLQRHALHAEALAFRHPTTGERVSFESEWPRDLRKAWRRAEGG